MSRKCIIGNCENKEGLLGANYAGFDVLAEGDFPFPKRIVIPVIPGVRNKDFLCRNCINQSFKLSCRVHGMITKEYKGGKPPVCEGCMKEMDSIKKGNIPGHYPICIQLKELVTQKAKTISGALMLVSRENEVFFVHKDKALDSDALTNLDFEAKFEGGLLKFLVKPKKRRPLIVAKFIPVSEKDLAVTRGPWIELWRSSLIEKLSMEKVTAPLALCSFEHLTPKENEFGGEIVKEDICLVSFEDVHLVTYPQRTTPSLDRLTSWAIINAGTRNELLLKYMVNGSPEVIILRELLSKGSNSLSQFKTYLPATAESDRDTLPDIVKTALVDIYLYPEGKKKRVLLRLDKDKSITSCDLQSNEKISFIRGFRYTDTYLLVSEDFRYADCYLPGVADQDLKPNLKSMKPDLFVDTNPIFFFLELGSTLKALSLTLMPTEAVTTDGRRIAYGSIERVDIEPISNGFAQIQIHYVLGSEANDSNVFSLISPERYAYAFSESLAVQKAQAGARNRTTLELYDQYHKLRRQDLLVGMFSDVILLNLELDSETPLEDLAKEVAGLSLDQFYGDTRLYNLAVKKLILMSVTIPAIKRNFEVLSAFYPYYQFQSDFETISNSFGPENALKIAKLEERRIVQSSRRNVKTVQANLHRIFSEIDSSVRPVEQLFAREQLKKTWEGYVAKYLPKTAQGVLVGAAMVTIGISGVGILAGMLGIRELGDHLNSIQRDKETALLVMRALENSSSWWQVLKDTLSVVAYEAAGAIDIENGLAKGRDIKILQSLKEGRKVANQRLDSELRRQIENLTKRNFREVIEGKGIRVSTIASNIVTATERGFKDRVQRYIGPMMESEPRIPPGGTDDNGR